MPSNKKQTALHERRTRLLFLNARSRRTPQTSEVTAHRTYTKEAIQSFLSLNASAKLSAAEGPGVKMVSITATLRVRYAAASSATV
jgi:hypothetical protein